MDIIEIKKYMKDNKITYEMLSAKSEIPLNTLKNRFRGKTLNPRIDTMQAIEKALGIEKEKAPTDLTDGEQMLIELFRQIPKNQQDLVVSMITSAIETLNNN